MPRLKSPNKPVTKKVLNRCIVKNSLLYILSKPIFSDFMKNKFFQLSKIFSRFVVIGVAREIMVLSGRIVTLHKFVSSLVFGGCKHVVGCHLFWLLFVSKRMPNNGVTLTSTRSTIQLYNAWLGIFLETNIKLSQDFVVHFNFDSCICQICLLMVDTDVSRMQGNEVLFIFTYACEYV